MDPEQMTYRGPDIDDTDILSALPSHYEELLIDVNGFILNGGWLHVRGACSNPHWHSIREAWMGPRALHHSFTALLPSDVPFAQDALGNQFIIRSDRIFKLNGEKGLLEPLDCTFPELLKALFVDPDKYVQLDHIRHFQEIDGPLEPGELLNAYPPIASRPLREASTISLRPVSIDDQLQYLSELSSSLIRNEALVPERPIAARDLAFRRLSELIEFLPPFDEFYKSISSFRTVVLSGPNNSGKTLLLKCLKSKLGSRSYMLAMDRFYHVFHLSTGMRDPSQIFSINRQFVESFSHENQNAEKNLIDLNQIIIGLNNPQREKLLSICGDLLDTPLSLRLVDEANDFSPRYIDMDGLNVALGSTGVRLLLTIVGICLDDRFPCLLIDEPELGLSPGIQTSLASLLLDGDARNEYFPHLEQVVVATHSHLFLDRRNIRNNFLVSKHGTTVEIQQVTDFSIFNRLQFNLLGNSLESLFFPAAIVVVEGKTDQKYLNRVFHEELPNATISVLNSNGDPKRKIHSLIESFGEIQKSPYRDRIFVVLDSIHEPSLLADLEKQGLRRENIVIWSQNGIEYFYPLSTMQDIFSCSQEQVLAMRIDDDLIEINAISLKKDDLCNQVLDLYTSGTEITAEVKDKLLAPIRMAIL